MIQACNVTLRLGKRALFEDVNERYVDALASSATLLSFIEGFGGDTKLIEEAKKKAEEEARKKELAEKKAAEEEARKAAEARRQQNNKKQPAQKRDNLKRVEFPAKEEKPQGGVNILSGDGKR